MSTNMTTNGNHTDEEEKHEDVYRFCVLISCGGEKQELDDGETVRAEDLYNSGVHTVKVNYGQAADTYFIASAKHGLVHPDEQLAYTERRRKPTALAVG